MAKADVIEVVNSTNSKMSFRFARNSNTGGEIAAEPAEAHCAAVNRIYDNAAHHEAGPYKSADSPLVENAPVNTRPTYNLQKFIESTNTMDNERALHELEIGRRIQLSFLPSSLPQPAGWQISGALEAAREVSGDFYDAFALSQDKRMGLVVADVCDKGVGAALFMALFRSLLRAFADQHYSLGWMDVLGEERSSVGRRRTMLSTGTAALKNAIDLTNRYIARNHGDTSMFATVFFAVIDPATGALVYINAGHERPVVRRANGSIIRLNPTGPALGLFEMSEYAIGECALGPGDALIAYTDGVLDAQSVTGERFGDARFLDALAHADESPDALIQHIRNRLAEFTTNAAQFDDITLLVAKRLARVDA